MAQEEITLEEIFDDLRREVEEINNPPLSFTRTRFCEEMGVSKSKANKMLLEFEQQGRVRRIWYRHKDKNGKHQRIKGWQWIVDDENNNSNS